MSITIFCDYKGRIPAFMPKMTYFYSVFLYFWYVSYILLTCVCHTKCLFLTFFNTKSLFYETFGISQRFSYTKCLFSLKLIFQFIKLMNKTSRTKSLFYSKIMPSRFFISTRLYCFCYSYSTCEYKFYCMIINHFYVF